MMDCVSGERGALGVPGVLAGEGRRGAVRAAGREGQEDRRDPKGQTGMGSIGLKKGHVLIP